MAAPSAPLGDPLGHALGNALEMRPRGAVPVGVADRSPDGVPHPAQKRADAGTGWEHVGQGSVTRKC